jgi:broad specificity phosphatase PhoE
VTLWYPLLFNLFPAIQETYLTHQNLHFLPHLVIVRAGQTNDAVSGRLGRDLPLNNEGLAWSKTLGEHIKSKYSIVAKDANQRLKTSESPEVLQVWSSALIRAVQTAKAISPYT